MKKHKFWAPRWGMNLPILYDVKWHSSTLATQLLQLNPSKTLPSDWIKKRKGLLYTHIFSVVWQCTKSQIRAFSTAEYEDRDHNHALLVMIIYNTPEPKHISCITLMNTIFIRIWDNFCLVHHPKIESCLIIGHKVQHVQHTYYHENRGLWGGLSYIQTNSYLEQASKIFLKNFLNYWNMRKHWTCIAKKKLFHKHTKGDVDPTLHRKFIFRHLSVMLLSVLTHWGWGF